MGYAEYRTIAGVSGPLVVAEGVKVSCTDHT
jgi:vacuolar-type H+-ATPase subunit B/Vma2